MDAAASGIERVRARIASAARAAGRDPSAITLIVVSKTFDAEAIRPVLAAGAQAFGENRVKEAQAKWPALRAAHPDVRLHLIGALQTNKVREAVALFDCVHSLDRDGLAAAIARERDRGGRTPRLFVQVNIGNEPQKSGIPATDAARFLERCREVHKLPIDGLMGVPPVADDPAPHFEILRQLAAELGLASLSMGMSADYETAIRYGATHVRVGSAIFGARGGGA